MLIPVLILAEALLAQGKYGAFSPSAAKLPEAPVDDAPSAVIKRVLTEHKAELEACASALTTKAPRWRFEAIGGTIPVFLELDEKGNPSSNTRIQQPLRGNAKANECLVNTVKKVNFGARAWPKPLNLVAVTDAACTVQDVGNDFLDITCSGKFRGVFSSDSGKK